MRTYNQFLDERAFSQVGKDRIAKQRAQNNQNRLRNKAAEKGAQIIKQKLLPPASSKQRFNARSDEKQVGKGPDRAYGGGAYPKTQTPDKKAMRNSQSAKNARMRQRYLERQKQDKAQAKTKGGFMGGLKKSFGGDLVHKDPDKKREARFERGHKTGDQIKATLKTALDNKPGRREGGSATGNLSGPKRGQRGGGD